MLSILLTSLIIVAVVAGLVTVSYFSSFKRKFFIVIAGTIVSLLAIVAMSYSTWSELHAKEEKPDDTLNHLLIQMMVLSSLTVIFIGVVLFLAMKYNLKGDFLLTGSLDDISDQVKAYKLEEQTGEAYKEASKRRKELVEGRKSPKSSSSSSSVSSSPVELRREPARSNQFSI